MHKFDHEKLIVYQAAIRFVVWSSSLLDTVPRRVSVHNQLERAATSIALNIAEGNASALECAACIDVLVVKKLIEVEPAEAGKELLAEIVSMMNGLIRANSGDRRV